MFTIIHISDLHITGQEKTHESALKVLLGAVKDELRAISDPGKRFLVITGDLVDSPNAKALRNARTFLQNLRPNSQTKSVLSEAKDESCFDSIFIVPGNHDVKKTLGIAIYSSAPFADSFKDYMSKEIDESDLHLIGLDSTPAELARGRVSKAEYDKFMSQIYSAKARASSRASSRVRIVALHHHCLPLAEDEHGTEWGVEAEPYMYLRAPAQFLHACISADVSLVLHGHRHVHGFARYSVPRQSGYGWADLHVLSCPSSTGHTTHLDAGFNIVHFDSVARTLKVFRYLRKNNVETFSLKDSYTINTRQSDRAFDVAFRLRQLGDAAPLHRVREISGDLFKRRAFMGRQETSWQHFLHRLQVTTHVWRTEVLARVPVSQQSPFCDVLWSLDRLRAFVAYEVLNMHGGDWDRIGGNSGEDEVAFLRELPQESLSNPTTLEKRQGLLTELHANLGKCGISLPPFATQ